MKSKTSASAGTEQPKPTKQEIEADFLRRQATLPWLPHGAAVRRRSLSKPRYEGPCPACVARAAWNVSDWKQAEQSHGGLFKGDVPCTCRPASAACPS